MKKRKNKTNYLSDEYVTHILLRDIKNGKVSEELGKIFLEIQKRVLLKPNFANYYGTFKDEMISEGVELFLTHWNKFKPYRVKHNYKYKDSGKFLIRNGIHKEKILYTNKCFDKYDMLEIDNRTYTVKNCYKKDDYYVVELFNKLKNNISKDTTVVHLIPKGDLFNPNNKNLRGGFTYLTTFAFTGATNKIKSEKKEKAEIEKMLNRINNDINHKLSDQEKEENGYINIYDIF